VAENRSEELLGGLPVALRSVCVIARIIGNGETVMGVIGLDGMNDPGLGERLLQ
jgi:hypothetical protein